MMGGPDLASILGGMGGGPPEAAPAAPDDGGGSSDADTLAHVKAAIKELEQGAAKESDAVERASLAKVIATLHQWLANDQKSAEAALGGGPATRVLRKAY